jgi:uncharacterized membrane protein YqgA involved in biofilm formation
LIGLGTLINVAAILVGGALGILCKRLFAERVQQTLLKANGLCVLFIGISGALGEMLTVQGTALRVRGTMIVILSFVCGALLGEAIDIDRRLEHFGLWLRRKSGSEGDATFLNGFLTASFTVCIGAMAIVGSINDGLYGDYTILVTKAILDFIIIMIMAASLGKGTIFSAIPVAILQGGVTALSVLIKPIMTETALLYLSVVGNILIFCVGINLVFGKKIKVANLLPSIIFAVAGAFLPIKFI